MHARLKMFVRPQTHRPESRCRAAARFAAWFALGAARELVMYLARVMIYAVLPLALVLLALAAVESCAVPAYNGAAYAVNTAFGAANDAITTLADAPRGISECWQPTVTSATCVLDEFMGRPCVPLCDCADRAEREARDAARREAHRAEYLAAAVGGGCAHRADRPPDYDGSSPGAWRSPPAAERGASRSAALAAWRAAQAAAATH